MSRFFFVTLRAQKTPHKRPADLEKKLLALKAIRAVRAGLDERLPRDLVRTRQGRIAAFGDVWFEQFAACPDAPMRSRTRDEYLSAYGYVYIDSCLQQIEEMLEKSAGSGLAK